VNLTELLSLAAYVAIPLIVGILGGIATGSSTDKWYRTIRKPSWNPPDWLFGPVWTLLYLLMGVALWLVSSSGWSDPRVQIAVFLFGAQLLFNLLWSVIFFGLRRPGWALAEILVLWVLILFMVLQFYLLRPLAGLLLVPYQVWVTFAAGLNASIWSLNRSQNEDGNTAALSSIDASLL